MQKKTDRRVRKTKTQLRNGLAMLMKEKSVGEITVKELVDQVDINRSTFLFAFIQIYQGCCMRLRMIWQRRWNVQSESIQLKSERIMDFIFFRTYFKCQTTIERLFLLWSDLTEIYDLFRKWKLFWQETAGKCQSRCFRKKVIRWITFYAYCLNGCLGFVKTWLADKKSCTPEFAADFIYRMVVSSMRAFCETREEVQEYTMHSQ